MGGRGASSGGRSNYKDYENSSEEAVNKAFGSGNGGYTDDWQNGLSEEEYASLEQYTNNDFNDINPYWRDPDVYEDYGHDLEIDEVIQNSRDIHNAINRYDLKANTVFRRADDGGLLGLRNINANSLKSLVGKTVVSDSFLSSAVGYQDVWKDKKSRPDVIYNIKTRKGKGIGAYIAGVSYHPNEKEFLFDIKSAFRVAGFREDNGGYTVDLEYIGKKPFNFE